MAITRAEEEVTTPIVVDLGKVRKKRIRELKKGRGKLVADVEQVMEEVRDSLGESAHGKQLVPVVILFQKKARKKKGSLLPFGF
jgi:hypothetical protein